MRQRIAGALLVCGGGGVIVSYFLPWTYASWPVICPTCVPESQAPADDFLHAFSPFPQGASMLSIILLMAIVVGLPLALLALGVRLLTRSQPVRTRWKVLVVLASIVGACSWYVLAFVMGLHYVDGPPPLIRIEIGEYMSMLAPLAVLAAGIVMPRKRRTAG